ncbi:MAG: chemotaxis-specific protein-glutamate methyltransferase CheB [Natrialbaceae archaeon]
MADVVVVDDSQFMRVQIREILQEGGHSVVGEAENGKRALEVVSDRDPDAVTMDVKMPGIDGIEAVERIMAECPTPVLMLSRYTAEGAETTLDALEAGAVEFMMKPDGEVTTGLVEYADDLVELVGVVARADVSSRTTRDAVVEAARPTLTARQWETPPTLVLAASTGGPSEIQRILSALPADTGLRVLVVQHMPVQFTGRFAERLDDASTFDVAEAADGSRVGPGEAVVARGGTHRGVDRDTGTELVVSTNTTAPIHSVRPAADFTLESVAETVAGPVCAVVISGMGRDGAAGVEAVAGAGGSVVVQSPDSARIESMPEHAIETGAADAVVPTAEIPGAVLDEFEAGR